LIAAVVLHLLKFFPCRDESSWRGLLACSVGFRADVLFVRSAGDLVAGGFLVAARLPRTAFVE
jgi:hypothetical protein